MGDPLARGHVGADHRSRLVVDQDDLDANRGRSGRAPLALEQAARAASDNGP